MNEKITVQRLVELLAEKHAMTRKDAEAFVKGMFELIGEALAEEKYVKIKGLGTFKLTEVDNRESVDVNTGERIEIQRHIKISFTPDNTMRDLINKPFSHFETVILNENTKLDDTETETPGEEEDNTVEMVVTVPAEEAPAAEEMPAMEAASVAETAPDTPSVETPMSETAPETPSAETPMAEAAPETPSVKTPMAETVVETPTVETPMAEAASAEETASAEVPPAETVPPTKSTDLPPAPEQAELPVSVPAPASAEPPAKPKSRIPWGILIVILVLLCVGIGIYFYTQGNHRQPAATVPAPATPAAETVTQPQDTLAEEIPADTVPAVPKASRPVHVSKITLADTATYDIAGTQSTYTVQEGESLVKISLKFYGTKDLWPYIVKHNRDVIKNADVIPVGTVLRIPELVPKQE